MTITFRATSKIWIRTVKNLDPEKHGSGETWKKYGIKKMSAFREFNTENVQFDL